MPKPEKVKKLTNKEKVFCLEYVTHWNGTKAAIDAGYSKNSAKEIAYENLTKPHIQAEIQRVLDQKALTVQEILGRLSDQGRANLAELVEFYDVPVLDKDGKKAGERQSVRMKPEAFEKYGYLIKSITPTTAGDFKIELHDSVKAMELIGRHRNMFKETKLNIDLSKLTDAQLERIANGEDPLQVIINGNA